MSLSKTERETRAMSMFGISTEQLQDMVETSIYRRLGPLADVQGDVMLAMSILSDAQECMAHGDTETARQYINRAKYVLNYYVTDRE